MTGEWSADFRSMLAYEDEEVPLGVGGSGKRGCLDLRFGVRGGRARLLNAFGRVPFAVPWALHHDPAWPELAVVYLAMPTGGIVQGDRLAIKIRVDPEAAAHVTTQAATKVYRMTHNYARQDTYLELADDAYLEYWPDPLIPFSGARFAQRTVLDLAPTATLIYRDVLTSGRVARGERFAFEAYESQTSARCGAVGGSMGLGNDPTPALPVNGEGVGRWLSRNEVGVGRLPLVHGGTEGAWVTGGFKTSANRSSGCSTAFVDNLRLVPAIMPLDSRGLFAGHDVLATLYVLNRSVAVTALVEAVATALDSTDLYGGATALPNGAGVVGRVLGPTSSAVLAALEDARRAIRAVLDRPPATPLRK